MKTPDFRKIELIVPAYWSPEQALAVFELIDDVREKIWDHYGLHLQKLIAEQHKPPLSHQANTGQAELPF
jgi:hypothetical protein